MLDSNDVLLREERGSLSDALEEEVEVNHVLLDLNYWQVDKHTSNLGCVGLHKVLNEFENGATNSLLVVRIVLVHRTQNRDSNAVELVSKRVLRRRNSADLEHSAYWKWWCRLLGHGHRGWSSVNWWLSLLISTALASLVAAPTLIVRVISLSLIIRVLLRSVVIATLVEVWLLRASLTTHTGHQLLDDLSDLVHVSSIDRASLTSFLKMTLEVLLVFVVFVLEITILLDLVVVNIKGSVVYNEVLGVFGGLGLIRSLVANKGVRTLTILCFENAQ